MNKAIRRKLPKATWLHVGWSRGTPYFAKFRLANAIKIQAWRVEIIVRAPWLERSARALHPELFERADG